MGTSDDPSSEYNSNEQGKSAQGDQVSIDFDIAAGSTSRTWVFIQVHLISIFLLMIPRIFLC